MSLQNVSTTMLRRIKGVETTPNDFVNQFKNIQTDLTIYGNKAVDSMNHLFAYAINVTGIKLSDVLIHISQVSSTFNDIEQQFIKYCEDYGCEIKMEQPSMQLEFAIAMLYDIAPQTRTITKRDSDKTWNFNFNTYVNGVSIIRTVSVCTFKFNEPTKAIIENKSGHLILSVRQASLLAVRVLCIANDEVFKIDMKQIITTPLAGAIISLTGLDRIAIQLKKPRNQIARILICSAQSGGHILPDSE